ncbi:baseplate J/gp47 family protein, partial [Escherichia coli]|uniref:baseplate J/gp47 family protein n=1 Tax=Escherichia coli TaxID=562 RepID=UPI003EE1ADDB
MIGSRAKATRFCFAASCTEPGTAGNGWQPAQVSQLLDEIDNVDMLVSNLTVSSGGSE